MLALPAYQNTKVYNPPGGAAGPLTMSASVTHWDPTLLLPDAGYAWTGSGSAEDPGQAPGAGWLVGSRVTASERGIVLETTSPDGVVTASLPGLGMVETIAGFVGASVQQGEAFFAAFGPDEAPAFDKQGETYSTTTFSTGVRSLQVAAGKVLTTRGAPQPLARATGPILLSAMVLCTGGGAKIELALRAPNGVVTALAPGLTIGAGPTWQRLEATIDGGGALAVGSSVVLVFTGGAGGVFVDHVWYAPLGAGMTATAHNLTTGLALAGFGANGGIVRTAYDSRLAAVAATDATGIVLGTAMQLYSRDGRNAAGKFSAAAPNAAVSSSFMKGGTLYDFANPATKGFWTTTGTSMNGALVVAKGQSAALTNQAQAGFAVRLDLSQIPAYGVAFSVSFGKLHTLSWISDANPATGTLKLSFYGGAVQTFDKCPWSSTLTLIDVRDPDMPGGPGLAYLFTNALAVSGASSSQTLAALGDVTITSTDKGALSVHSVVVGNTPTLSIGYGDGAGKARQAQAVESVGSIVVDGETLYDELGAPTFQTLPVRKHAGAKAVNGLDFEPGFVTDRAPGSGDLWSVDKANAKRGRMAGLVQSWRALDEPTLDASETFYSCNGTYHRYDPLQRPYQATASDSHYIVDTPHAVRQEYGQTPAGIALMRFSGIADAQFGSLVNRGTISAIDDTTTRQTNTITDVLGRTVISATGYGTTPFSPKAGQTKPDVIAFGTSFAYAAGGMATVTTRLPNGFTPPPGNTGAFTTDRVSNALGQVVRVKDPDSGAAETLYDKAGRVRFWQDAKGAANGYLDAVDYDVLGRVVAKGVIRGVPMTDPSLTSALAVTAADLERGLVSRWAFDQTAGDTVADTTGQGGDIVLTGQDAAMPARWQLDAPNGVGCSFGFSATPKAWFQSKASRPFAAIKSAVTMSFWMRLATLDRPAVSQNIAWGRGDGGALFSLALGPPLAALQIGVRIDATEIVSAAVAGAKLIGWSHVVVTYDANAVSIHVDGISVASAKPSVGFRAPNSQWGFGSFAGSLADARVYNRVLSPAEIAALRLEGLTDRLTAYVFDRDGRSAATLTNGQVVATRQVNRPYDDALRNGLLARFRLDEGGGTVVNGLATIGTQAPAVIGATTSGIAGLAGGPSGLGFSRRQTSATGTVTFQPPTGLSWGKTFFASFWCIRGDGAQSYFRCPSNDSNAIDIGLSPTKRLSFTLKKDAKGGTLDAALPDGAAGSWLHVVAGVDNGLMRLWVDGEPVASAQTTLAEVYQPATYSFLAGIGTTMVDLRLYNRALDIDDIERLHAEGLIGILTEPVVTETFAYDRNGRILTKGLAVPAFDATMREVGYTYDALGRVAAIAYP